MVVAVPTSRYEAERVEAEEASLRRLQRLKEVRAQERHIAALTRRGFREAAGRRAGELLEAAEDAWASQHEAEVRRAGTRVAAVLDGVGTAHGAADAVREAQAAQAATNLATWRQGLAHEQVREERAALATEAHATERAWQTAATTARREHVARTEAERAASVAAAARATAALVSVERVAAAAAAVEDAVAVPLTVHRSRVRVDYHASRLHDTSSSGRALAVGAAGCSREFAHVATQRHAALSLPTGTAAAAAAAVVNAADGGRSASVAGLAADAARTAAASARGACVAWEGTPWHAGEIGAHARAEAAAAATRERRAAEAAHDAEAKRAARVRGTHAADRERLSRTHARMSDELRQVEAADRCARPVRLCASLTGRSRCTREEAGKAHTALRHTALPLPPPRPRAASARCVPIPRAPLPFAPALRLHRRPPSPSPPAQPPHSCVPRVAR